jgi:hypothetical protein
MTTSLFKKVEGFLSDEKKCREHHARYIAATGSLNRIVLENSLTRMCIGDSSFSVLPNAEWKFLCHADDFFPTFVCWIDRAAHLFTQHTNFGYKTIIAHKLCVGTWYINITLENICECFIDIVRKWLRVRYYIKKSPRVW